MENLNPAGIHSYSDVDNVIGRHNAVRKTVLILLFLVLLLSISLSFFAPNKLSRSYLSFCVGMVIFVFILQCFYKFSMPKPVNWFSLDVLFFIMFFMVHFWYTFSWLVGISLSDMVLWRDTAAVCYASNMSASGLIAFLIGFDLLSHRFASVRRPFLTTQVFTKWRIVGRFIFWTGVIATSIYVLILREELLGGAYEGSSVGGRGSRVLYILLNILLTVGVLVLSISSAQLTGKWKIGVIQKFTLFFFLIYLVVLGDRSTMFGYVVVLGAVYTNYVKPLSLKKLIIGICIGLIVNTAGDIGRLSAERTITSFTKEVLTRKEGVSLESGAYKLAGSVRTLNQAVSVIPSQDYYFLGKLKVSELISIIPLTGKLLPYNLQYFSSSQYLTWSIQKHFRSGTGSTIVADIYVDFGYPFVVIILLLLGIFSKYIQQKAFSSGSVVSGVAFCCLVSSMATLPRYNFIPTISRGVLWPVMVVILCRLVFGVHKESSQDYPEIYDYDLASD